MNLSVFTLKFINLCNATLTLCGIPKLVLYLFGILMHLFDQMANEREYDGLCQWIVF